MVIAGAEMEDPGIGDALLLQELEEVDVAGAHGNVEIPGVGLIVQGGQRGGSKVSGW